MKTKRKSSLSSNQNQAYRKANKFPAHWKLQIPKRYKTNAITGDLHRSWRINSNFYHEKNEIRNKFSTVVYPMRFVNSLINDYESKEHDPMTPCYLLKHFESKPILIDVPFCNENKKVSKQLLNKLTAFTKEKYDFKIFWKTKKIR